VKISGYMYKFQDLTPISGHFRTNFRNFRTTPRPVPVTAVDCYLWAAGANMVISVGP